MSLELHIIEQPDFARRIGPRWGLMVTRNSTVLAKVRQDKPGDPDFDAMAEIILEDLTRREVFE